jgi:hypothetical protein
MTTDDAVAAVVAAWLDPGVQPGYHRFMQDRLHTEWPVLAKALEALAAKADK